MLFLTKCLLGRSNLRLEPNSAVVTSLLLRTRIPREADPENQTNLKVIESHAPAAHPITKVVNVCFRTLIKTDGEIYFNVFIVFSYNVFDSIIIIYSRYLIIISACINRMKYSDCGRTPVEEETRHLKCCCFFKILILHEESQFRRVFI